MSEELGRLATRVTIDLAVVAYFAAEIVWLVGRGRRAPWRAVRAIWTVGWFLYLVHVAAAFHFDHHWSHREAYLETARRTAELFGWRWGGGLYFNYAFTLAWSFDVFWQWLSPASHRRRPRWLSLCWHGFFLFMVVNATIVFETGPIRWLGLAGCTALLVAFAISLRPTRIGPR